MSQYDSDKTIAVLKILLKIDNIEIMKCVIESFIEELEDLKNIQKNKNEV